MNKDLDLSRIKTHRGRFVVDGIPSDTERHLMEMLNLMCGLDAVYEVLPEQAFDIINELVTTRLDGKYGSENAYQHGEKMRKLRELAESAETHPLIMAVSLSELATRSEGFLKMEF